MICAKLWWLLIGIWKKQDCFNAPCEKCGKSFKAYQHHYGVTVVCESCKK